MKEREISLIDLMAEILLSWRWIIVWMIVGALAMGAFSYVRSSQAAEAARAEMAQQVQKPIADKETELAQLEETLTAAERSNVWTVMNYEAFNQYGMQSILLKIDPVNVPQMQLTFLISSGETKIINSLQYVYVNSLPAGLMEWLAENGEADSVLPEISELVTVSTDFNTLFVSSGTEGTLMPEASGTFSVTIIHESEEACRALSQQILAYMEAKHGELSKQIGAHELQMVNESFARVTDTALLNRQRTMLTDMTSGDAAAEKLKGEFTEAEARYYALLTEVEMEEETGAQQSVAAASIAEPSVSVKYVVLGMVLFAFLYVFYLFLKYILNSKLRATDEVQMLYDVTQLGLIPQSAGKKKVFSLVDDFILKLRDRNKRKFSFEEAVGLAAVAVKMSARKNDLSKVFCVGCNMQEASLKVAEAIQGSLQEADLEMTVLNNVLYNQETLEQLQDAKGAFLLEKAGETLYDEIARELELLKRQEIVVLGVVVVE